MGKPNVSAEYADLPDSSAFLENLRTYATLFLRKFVPILFVLYVMSLTCSMAGMEIFSWSLSFFFLLFVSLDRNQTVKLHSLGVEIPVIFLIAVVVLGLRVNAPESDFIFAFGRLRNIALLFIFAHCFQLIREPKRFYYILLGFAGVIAVYGIWQHYSGIDLWRHNHRAVVLLPWTKEQLYATVGFFNHHLTYAHSFAMILCAAWAFLLLNQKTATGWRVLVFSILMVIGVSLIFSYARGVWIALVVSIPAMAMMVNRRLSLFIFAALIATGAGLYFSDSVFQGRAKSILEDKYKSNEERRKLWAANYEMFKEHPFLGVGYGQNERETIEYYNKLGITEGMAGHAHNNYIEFLATTGILGFLCYLFFIAILLGKTIRLFLSLPASELWTRILVLSALGAQITFHIGGFTQFNFGDSKVQHQFIFWVALVCYLQNQSKEKTRTPASTPVGVTA